MSCRPRPRHAHARPRPSFRPTLEQLEDRCLLSITLAPTPSSLSPAVGNSPYNQSFTAGGGSGSYTFSESGNLPVGLSLSPSGLLTGTPEQGGSFSFTVTATDNNNPAQSTSQTYVLNTALGFSQAPLPEGTVDATYSQDAFITAVGGSGDYTYSETGALPAGMSFSTSTGQLSGTPTQAGPFTFTVSATDNQNSGLTGSQTYTLPIGLALTSSNPLTTIPVGALDTNAFLATGGNAGDSYTYSASGNLPPGMSLSSAGQLTGTPTLAGSYSFTVTAIDDNAPALMGSLDCTLNVGLQMGPAALPPAALNQSYSQPLFASGGSGSYTFALQAGSSLPPGLSLAALGTQAQLKGTPTQAGTYTFTLTATDQNNSSLTVSQAYTLFIGGLQVSGPAGGMTPGTVGIPYSETFSASGGSGSYTFSVAGWSIDSGQGGSGSFNGLSLSSDGQLTGTPTQTGQYQIVIGATDGTLVGEQVFDLVVFADPQPVSTVSGPLTLSPGSLPPAQSGSAYSQTITASGGSPGGTYSYSVAGALPPGMSLQPNGMLTGTPTQAGIYNFTISAADDSNPTLTGSQQYTLTVVNNGLASTFVTATTNLPQSTLSVASTSGFPSFGVLAVQTTTGTALVVYNGTTPTSFTGCSGDSGTTDNGFLVTLLPTTAITTPATLPTDTLTVGSTDGFPTSGSLLIETATGLVEVSYTGITGSTFTGCTGGSGTLAIGDQVNAPISMSPLILPAGTVSAAYKPYWPKGLPDPAPYQITASGGTGGYTYQITGGTLPAGISFSSSSGQLTGTPTEAGTFSFVVTATDSAGETASQTYSLTILPLPAGSAPYHYSPQEIQQAYGINNIILGGGIRGDGSGQTIAIIAAGDDASFVSSTDPNFDSSDLHQFDVYFGLPDPPSFLKLDGHGGTSYPGAGHESETAQDVEWAHALAPGANIILFEGPGATQTALNYPGVTVISNSYSDQPSQAGNYLAPIGKGVTYVSAAGDNNSEVPTHDPIYPGAYPYVLSAGMTELETDTQGNYIGEAGNAWADWGATNEGQPAYQNGIVSAISTTQRTTPDVSFIGEATARANSTVARLVGGQWGDANGTSLATPSWAALIAIANQGRALAGEDSLNGPTDTLPLLYNLPASDFHKITHLDNGSTSQGSSTYNQSGLGSPVANLLIPGLVGGQNTITGIVWAGANHVGLANVTVYLDVHDTGQLAPGDPTTTTGPDGSYSFVVAPGTDYRVRIVAPAGFTQSTADPSPLTFAAGSTVTAGLDFGLLPSNPVRITGFPTVNSIPTPGPTDGVSSGSSSSAGAPTVSPRDSFVALAVDEFFLDVERVLALFLHDPALDASIASLSASIADLRQGTPDAWLAVLAGDWAAGQALHSAGGYIEAQISQIIAASTLANGTVAG
jgi:hypothetical protein